MALFSLLIALLLERTIEFGDKWQFEYWFCRFVDKLRGLLEPTAWIFQLVSLVAPALVTYFVLQWVAGAAFGFVSLVLWILIPLLCIGCLRYRQLYKEYLLTVCQEDVQGSYHVAARMAELEALDIDDEAKLGAKVGRQLTWINYRFYCAIVLMMIIGGPVAVVFYASVRTLDLLEQRQELPNGRYASTLLFILDWLPARIVALGYVLVGNFAHAIGKWASLAVQPKLPAYELVSNVAMEAEQMSHRSSTQGICMESTCRLVKLAKRNLILLVGVVSLMTIAGVLI